MSAFVLFVLLAVTLFVTMTAIIAVKRRPEMAAVFSAVGVGALALGGAVLIENAPPAAAGCILISMISFILIGVICAVEFYRRVEEPESISPRHAATRGYKPRHI